MLNGKPYFLRGTNITLHRFFGDPLSKHHPWEDAWVRKLLGEIPTRMHWNAMRICIGPAPEMWLDIADEVGLLLQYEYAIWTGRFPWRHELWKTEELINEFKEFVTDNCNHPSVAIWDASNETLDDALREKVLPPCAVSTCRTAHRDNGYNVPQAPGDGYEDHPYIFSFAGKPPYYDMTALENMEGPPIFNAPASGHAAILNEYDTLFLKRGGTPVFWTKKFFDNLLGPHSTADQRFALRAYLLAGLTEFWRAFRFYAGVMYLAYLDADLPHSVTCDNFSNPETLELQPHYEEYVKEAFKPATTRPRGSMRRDRWIQRNFKPQRRGEGERTKRQCQDKAHSLRLPLPQTRRIHAVGQLLHLRQKLCAFSDASFSFCAESCTRLVIS